MNLDRASVGSIAQAKMEPAVIGGDVASAGQHILALAHAIGGQIGGGAGGVARAFGSADQLHLHPMMMIGIHIAQQHRRAVDWIDHNVDLAIVEQVAECRSTRRNHIRQP